jgi:hypothetical protein
MTENSGFFYSNKRKAKAYFAVTRIEMRRFFA